MILYKPLSELKREIEIFTSKYLPDDVDIYSRGKIIHDTIWKTNFFHSHEVAIINTPIIQRLRYINQMGFVSHVYPTARHSRFEHSLGVTILSNRFCDIINSKKDIKLSQDDIISIRLSALLHDVGHCLFSHSSELVYGDYLKRCIEQEFSNCDVNPSPHEFFSYLIVTSKTFQSYFANLCRIYSLNLDLREIALRIVGGTDSELNRFKTSIINGPFDADKLDYFHRDSQFSGIPVQLDLDRLLYEVDISDFGDDSNTQVKDLTIGIGGISSIEQIIFNKMILYTTIYNHHKVQSIDCMFKGIFEYILTNNIKININGKKKHIRSATDFLYLVDHDLFSLHTASKDVALKQMLDNILHRRLLKRALIISRTTVTNDCLEHFVSTPANRKEKVNELRELAKIIHTESKANCHESEIWIDIPKPPTFKDATMIQIRTCKGHDSKQYKTIDKFYPYKQFEELYKIHKLNFHVFAPEKCISTVIDASKKIFKERFNMEFNEMATRYV